jgi:hypothetical protein
MVNVSTDYPFDDVVTVTVTGATAGMPLYVRIPSWATAATLAVNGGAAAPVGGANGTMFKVAAPAATTTVVLDTAPTLRVSTWYNGSVSISRGALVYALSIGENATVLASYAFQSKDYQVQPTTPWNYALLLDPANPEASLNFTRTGPPGDVPFGEGNWTVYLTGQARLVNGWTEQLNAAGIPPASPVCGPDGSDGCGPLVPVKLVPYAATLLRMTEMPYTLA